MKIWVVYWTLACLTLAALAACGGGGGETNTTTAQPSSSIADTGSVAPAAAAPTPVQASSLTGSIVKGPVNGAQVCAFELTASGKGKQLGCATSNADGTYALTLEFEGDVVVEATGGTFADEASGIAGTPLSAPLQSVTTLAKGPNTLHATSLTALAFSRAVAAGGLSTAAFQAKANQVRDAFGLPAEVDLVRTLPTLAAGSINAYGTALHGVSKMLGMGASLGGIVGNEDLDALKRSYGSAAQCVAHALVDLSAPAGSQDVGMVTVDDVALPGGGAIFTVTEPTPSWQKALPTSGTSKGCEVILNCPAPPEFRTIIYAGPVTWQPMIVIALPESSPEREILRLRVEVNGAISALGQLVIDTGPKVPIRVGADILAVGSLDCAKQQMLPSGNLSAEPVLTNGQLSTSSSTYWLNTPFFGNPIVPTGGSISIGGSGGVTTSGSTTSNGVRVFSVGGSIATK